MYYRVNNIDIEIHPSDSYWMSQTHRAVDRQLDGFQIHSQSDTLASYKINIRDYTKLPVAKNQAWTIVPHYCYYSNGIYVDIQQKIALGFDDCILDVWTIAGSRNISIPFLIQSLLLTQNKTYVHGAAVDVEGCGVLLPAFGGIGKTSFISQAVKRKGVRTLGDDMIIVTDQGKLEPFLRPFVLYKYHKPLFPEFFAENQIKYKPLTLTWRIYNRVRSVLANKLGRDWHQPDNIVRTGYIPVTPSRVLPKSALLSDPTGLDYVYILQRASSNSKIEVHSIDADHAIRFMLNVTYHEWYSQLRLLFSWLTHRSVSIAVYFTQVREILKSAISHSYSMNLISIPHDMSPSEIGKELTRYVIQ